MPVIIEDIQTDVTSYEIVLGGETLAPDAGIISIVVSRQVNKIASADIVFLDDAIEDDVFPLCNQDNTRPGTTVEINAGYHDEKEAIFKGIVVSQQLKIKNGRSIMTMYCKDEAVKMTMAPKSKYFIEKTDGDIWSEITGAYGLELEADTTTVMHAQMVQYNSTDWDFLLARAESNGLLVSTNDGVIKIAAPGSSAGAGLGAAVLSGGPVTATLGENLFELDAGMDARTQVKEVVVKSWDPDKAEVPEEKSAEPSFTTNGDMPGTDLADALGGESYFVQHGGALPTTEMKGIADARLLKSRLGRMRGRMKIQGTAALKPGDSIELAGVGPRFEGSVVATGIRHEIARGNWLTDVQFGDTPDLFLAANTMASPAALVVPRIPGLQVGIVTDIMDPLNASRVKVRIPVLDNNEEGIWARQITTDAGDNRGMVFRPEIGDEVIVGFLSDDPRYPIVLGSVHSANAVTPIPAEDANNVKGWVTRSEIKIQLNDDEKSILISTPGGHELTINEKDKSILIKDMNGNQCLMNDSGIAIESMKDIVLKATNDIKMEAINIESKASAQWKGEGGAGSELKSSGTTTVRGSMVMIN